VEFHPRPVGKPRRIRYHSDTPVNLNYYFALTATVLQRIMKLKALNFSGVKRGLFGNRAVEASFDVRPGKEQKITRNTPTWVRLWAIGEHTDARPLLERYHEMLRYSIIPQLTLSNLYDPLFAVTQQRIWAAGYDVTETEVHYIVKLMTHVLEMAGDTESPLGYPDEAQYRIARTIEQGWPTDGRPVPLPHWAKALLSMIGFEEELVVGNPIAALAGPLYGDLMFDTIQHGFNLVDTVNKLPFARHELEDYAAQIVDSLWDSHASLGMMEVYLPLVLGGILIDDRVFIRHEQKLDNLHAVHDIIGTYRETDNSDVQAVVTLCEDIVHFMLRKYGFRWGRI
jgi:hypothetical protein